MCDTFVVLGDSTFDGSVILGKNSDREPNEAHEVVVIPAANHPEGSLVECTYISIPQVPHTFAALLAKPFWIWGAEMGVNEHGVTIGNEAIFTRVPYEKGKSLTGMDLLRLALERGRTALEALQTITSLLEIHGQGGSCGFTHPFYYHNSFIIADPREAYVLETAGRQWVAEKVKSIRSISNEPSIGSTWDMASADLVKYAVDQRWCRGRDDFHFARCYADFLYTNLSAAHSRQVCSTGLLRAEQKPIDPLAAMSVLQSHGMRPDHNLRLDRDLLGATVCMHVGAGPVRNSQSVGSMVAHLTADLPTIWVTATSAPCTGIFKPVWLDAGYPLNEPAPTGTYDERCIWWRHEDLHRAVLEDYAGRMQLFQAERDDLQKAFWNEACNAGAQLEARRSISAKCFEEAGARTSTWLQRVQGQVPEHANRFYYSSAWNAFQRQAGMNIATVKNS